MSKEKLSWYDVEELAAVMCGIDVNDDDLTNKVENELYEKFDISFESFNNIIEKLYEMIDLGVSPLTADINIGFSNKEENYKRWVIKKDHSQNFISCVISWLLQGNSELSEKDKGYIQTISMNDKPKYDISITHAKNETETETKR